MNKSNIVIIGGGASGFFSAANIDTSKYDVCILEQNAEVLQKVKISGGGRCNVTHACFDARDLVQFYPRGHKELRSVFSKFQPGDTMAWFSERGVSLKIEDDNRIFPESNRSQTIIDCLLSSVKEKNIEIYTKTTVKSISKQAHQYLISTNREPFLADIVIFCTGSSPKALRLMENLGHTIVKPVPSLFTFNIKDDLLEGLSGTSFPSAEVRIPELKSEEAGALLITHWGLSGPAILKLSAWEARRLNDLNYHFSIEVNFVGIPPNDAGTLIQEFKQSHPKKTLSQGKPFEVTNRFWQSILAVSRINSEKQWAHLSAKETQTIIENLFKKKLSVTGKSTFKEEFVTAGGIYLKEIDFKNMKSKILPNFYIAGEVLDIDAVTGGFNFQACWSEAWLIAQDLNSI
ncbi:NAD(P)/FAD-dependent oxidoreductase [Riemerella anatipestifer]|uniref:Putative flavoprotein n=1 Tax=Riemerella anatipestifer RA-CH-1 TaxID=1228997 RepID=J9R1C0_RIEAN|nr:NAD(P)/FAD-dependent oxidoreductase [Riemerella anatipestifer]AFR35549.1 putative flavoprotein [Riemerella anatipestifer RA-CH-1]AIH02583.1 hi0933 family protein [Riemerella anatipestifer CH3]MCO7331884.1 NAD(P)/FAD-dependent oxidoreductase [Riemerella anatipestifer]MCO7350771.1 NAD(P)/FAD-dependent oxidoreductase [Riemerella anatipestifer]MCU7583316.1 NAD(P)/FAD-dependent oxidoreductase [Riemerella anatipestifer]